MENELLLINLIEVEDILIDDAVVEQENRMRFRRENPFEILSDCLFKKLFRLTKPLVRLLVDMLDPFLEAPTRISALDKSTKVLVALHFYGTGSYQMDIGYNIFSGISQPSVSRCIEEVTDAINRPEVLTQWVRFPNNMQELNAVRQGFFQKYNFPGVVGVIDGTHVAIVAPNTNDPEHPEHIYVNRKGYHSINVQLICDSNMKIINVSARFPGSANDLYIWAHSSARQAMETLSRRHPNEYYLLGDSGYMLRPWLQIPIHNPEPGTPQERYNNAFKTVRSIIEQCNGLLKMRFRCLLKHRVLHYTPTKSSKIINACVVLHNLCIMHNVPEPEQYEEGNVHVDLGIFNEGQGNNHLEVPLHNRDLVAGRNLQQQIILNYFLN